MYQWKEVRHTRTVGSGDNRRTETYYTHHKGWFSHMINSNHFHERWGHENPNVEWPFHDEQQQANEVNMGLTFLKEGAISQLGHSNAQSIQFNQGMEPQLGMANQKMANAFFGFLQCHGDKLESQPNGWEGKEVGRYRIRYFQDICGTATIIGQQIQDERMLMTIRKYNPAKIMVPYGQSTEVEMHEGCCGIENKCLCCYCYCAQKCVNKGMDECIYYACDGEKTIQEYTKS